MPYQQPLPFQIVPYINRPLILLQSACFRTDIGHAKSVWNRFEVLCERSVRNGVFETAKYYFVYSIYILL